MLLSHGIFYLFIFFPLHIYILLLFANVFCLLKLTENSKKRENWNERVFVPVRILVRIILMFNFCHFILCIVQVYHFLLLFKHIKVYKLNAIISTKFGFGMLSRITDDEFFNELQLSSNKNLEVRLVVLSIVDNC